MKEAEKERKKQKRKEGTGKVTKRGKGKRCRGLHGVASRRQASGGGLRDVACSPATEAANGFDCTRRRRAKRRPRQREGVSRGIRLAAAVMVGLTAVTTLRMIVAADDGGCGGGCG